MTDVLPEQQGVNLDELVDLHGRRADPRTYRETGQRRRLTGQFELGVGEPRTT